MTERRAVSFKMRKDWYDVLREVAEEQDVDVTAVLSSMISDSIPRLKAWLAERKRKRNDATA